MTPGEQSRDARDQASERVILTAALIAGLVAMIWLYFGK